MFDDSCQDAAKTDTINLFILETDRVSSPPPRGCVLFLTSLLEYRLMRTLLKSVLRGSIVGIISAIIGSTAFAIVDITTGAIQNGVPDLDSFVALGAVTMFFALIGSIFSVIPGFLGGLIITLCLHWDHLKGKLSEKKGFLKGALIGLLVGVWLCAQVYRREYLLVHDPPISRMDVSMDFDLFLSRVRDGLTIAVLVGGWAGRYLAKQMARQGPDPKASEARWRDIPAN
jgi:hypothetical protein